MQPTPPSMPIVELASKYPIMVRASGKTADSVTFIVSNLGQEKIRGFAGLVRVWDVVGNEVADLTISSNASIPAGKSISITDHLAIPPHVNGPVDYFLKSDGRNLTYVYLPERVVDKHGHVHYVRAFAPPTR